ncbi:hypothetical protein GCM10011390_35740 [Aureimonas endophytica]|uniref:DUF2125 domain-containing protein n=1 Tax=Aureimonas endophytica TaxID=2027858 RepID=A0A916ZTJ0_9HYPH|nr:DUF2125 domain-containing protein [Aureimonas endophytica]GGE13494.1 hypothetical protein GCM10011390_35740 [Aureimonas endophytica]
MAASSARRPGGARRAFVAVAAIAILLAAALSGVWYYLANRLDGAVQAAIEAAAGTGTTIACERQEVFGYPFRLGLRCEAVGVEAPAKELKAAAGALRTAAQVYDPSRIVAELDGPLLLDTPKTPPLDIRWRLFQASAHFWTEGVDRLALVIEGPDVALAGRAGTRTTLATSDHLEVHARRNGADLDFALSDDGVKAAQPELASLPPFGVAADLSVTGAADWLSGERPGDTLGEALRGRAGTIRSLKLAFAGTGAGSAEVSGPFSVDGDGQISGRFAIALTDPAAIADLAGRLVPEAEGIAGTIASGIGLVGRTENGRTLVEIDVKRGRASLGFIPLGKLPQIE